MKVQTRSEEEGTGKLFKVGMTLDEYFGEIKVQKSAEKEEKDEENLYETSQKGQISISKKLITYEIKETDEDNYEQSVDEGQKQFQESHQLSTNIYIPQKERFDTRVNQHLRQVNVQGSMSNSKGFRVRKQSNSPYKSLKKDPSSLTPNKNLAKTLYSNQWKLNDINKLGTSTIYGKFLKGIKEKKNQKYFRKKNTKELEYVLKYEQNMTSKYSKYNFPDIRIEGITDRLHERKNHHKYIK